jgi:hypothetical protein
MQRARHAGTRIGIEHELMAGTAREKGRDHKEGSAFCWRLDRRPSWGEGKQASGGQRAGALWNGTRARGWISSLRSRTHDLAAGVGEA